MFSIRESDFKKHLGLPAAEFQRIDACLNRAWYSSGSSWPWWEYKKAYQYLWHLHGEEDVTEQLTQDPRLLRRTVRNMRRNPEEYPEDMPDEIENTIDDEIETEIEIENYIGNLSKN